MRIFLIIIFLIYSVNNSKGQPDTLYQKKQKGFLFLASQHYMYDWPNGDEMRTGFDDFFFPSECLDIKCLLDSNKSIVFKNGLRVGYFYNRKSIKGKATLIKANDTSNCYKYENFYMLPVTMDYKLYNYDFANCRHFFFELNVKNGSHLRFEYLPKEIIPTKITVLSTGKK